MSQDTLENDKEDTKIYVEYQRGNAQKEQLGVGKNFESNLNVLCVSQCGIGNG